MRHLVKSDSVHDYGITIQGKAIFQLAVEHIKKALQTSLITSGFYKPYPTYYKNCYQNTNNIKNSIHPESVKYYKGCLVIMVYSNVFMKENNYRKFCLNFAFFDPDTYGDRSNNWNGFFSQSSFGGYPGITLYCPLEKNVTGFDPSRMIYDFEPKEILQMMKTGLNVNMSKLKRTFVHEFGHKYNFLQWQDKASKINKRLKLAGEKRRKPLVPKVKYKSPPSDYNNPKAVQQYSDYVNDPQEVNSRYLEWIDEIQKSFKRLLRVKDNDFDIRRAFKTFADFWEFYWEIDGFVPEELKRHATVATKKKLVRRLHGYYTFLVENPGVDSQEAEDFARDQMRYDFHKQNSYWLNPGEKSTNLELA